MAGAAIAGLSGVGMLATATPAFAASSPSSAEQFIADINALRAQVGVGQLSESSALDSIAAGWTVHLENAGTLSHNPDLAASAPSNWRALGENVGVGPNVSALQQAFTNSPEHYANMVDSSYNQIGVSVQIDSNGAMWVTEDYMYLPAAAPAPAPAPAAAPPTTAAPVVQSTAPVTRSTAPVVRSTASAPVSAPSPAQAPAPVSQAPAPATASGQSTSAAATAQASAPVHTAAGGSGSAAASNPGTSVTNSQAAAASGQATATTAARSGTVVERVSTISSLPQSSPAAATSSSGNAWLARAAIPASLLVSFVLFITRPRRPRRPAAMA
ncbi:MAG: CAP domain-containing protein [Acidimicrobiales bacterium]